MRERVYLAGGELEITPAETGTTVRCMLPLADHSRRAMPLSADQAVS
jgi:signal transduction histidine kinase